MSHPHHISQLSIDENGWILPSNVSASAEKIPISKKCHQLLDELQFTDRLSNEIFSHSSGQKYLTKDDIDLDVVQGLPKSDRLSELLRAVIAEIRRMGGPSSRENNANDNHNDAEGDDGEMKVVQNKRRGRRVRGRAAKLEEQRRLLQEQEAQKEKETENIDDDNDDDEQEPNGDSGANENEDIEMETSENDSNDNMSSDMRLASTFNTLRVLITVLRPILDHPYHNDTSLKMKLGTKKKKVDFYMISTHIFSPVSKGAWNDTRVSFFRMLNEVEPGLGNKVMKRTNDNSEYAFNAKEWVVSLFNHEQLSSQEYVLKKCIGEDLLHACKVSNHVSHKFNDALVKRFQNDDEKKQRMLQDSIQNLQKKLFKTLQRIFPEVHLSVYGSCLSGLALEGSHDVDVSVYIPQLDHLKQDFDAGVISAHEYEQKMKRVLYRIKGSLQRSDSFVDVFAITHARVPVIKGTDIRAKNPYEEDGSLSFDMCFLNDIAVVNSSLLREYSLFDNRVRMLMLSIKSFAKLNNIASAANGTLSSYSWLNLVVFYLQNIGFLPTLQCPELMEKHGFKPDPKGNRWHCINSLETFYLTERMVSNGEIWKQSQRCDDINLPVLLYGFFSFYCTVFPQQTIAASIRLGQMTLQKTSFKDSSKIWRLVIEDPFETYYSHCPHDLGCHLKEKGQEQMCLYLDQMMNDLQHLMMQEQATDALVGTFIGLFCTDSNSKQQSQPSKSLTKGNPRMKRGHKKQNDSAKTKTATKPPSSNKSAELGEKKVSHKPRGRAKQRSKNNANEGKEIPNQQQQQQPKKNRNHRRKNRDRERQVQKE